MRGERKMGENKWYKNKYKNKWNKELTLKANLKLFLARALLTMEDSYQVKKKLYAHEMLFACIKNKIINFRYL